MKLYSNRKTAYEYERKALNSKLPAKVKQISSFYCLRWTVSFWGKHAKTFPTVTLLCVTLFPKYFPVCFLQYNFFFRLVKSSVQLENHNQFQELSHNFYYAKCRTPRNWKHFQFVIAKSFRSFGEERVHVKVGKGFKSMWQVCIACALVPCPIERSSSRMGQEGS